MERCDEMRQMRRESTKLSWFLWGVVAGIWVGVIMGHLTLCLWGASLTALFYTYIPW